ncbi:MAG TPA: hypothetical protein VFV54_07130, partial [Thermoanaerobaculia bacterium]|nr:hypothetical protein [Thermoanaerobaculia bacterium]
MAALSLFMILVLTACATTPSTAPTHHRAILEATAASPEQWEGILRNVVNLRASFAPEPMEIEVVVH